MTDAVLDYVRFYSEDMDPFNVVILPDGVLPREAYGAFRANARTQEEAIAKGKELIEKFANKFADAKYTFGQTKLSDFHEAVITMQI